METNPINGQLNEIIAGVTGIPQTYLNADFDLVDSGVVDSLQILQLIDAFEKKFGVNISLDEILSYTTIGKIAGAIACAQSRVKWVAVQTHLLPSDVGALSVNR